MTNLVTATDISAFAPDLDTSSYSATTLSGLIAQASKKVAAFCNVKDFAQGTYTDKDRAMISNKGELLVSPRVRPVQSVSAINLSRGGFSVALTLADSSNVPYYDIIDPGNRVILANAYLYATGTYLAGGSSQLMTLKSSNLFCSITYYAGYSLIPDDVKDATILWIQDMISRRQNRAGVQSFSQGSLSMNFGKSGADGQSPLVKEAQSILMQGGYVRPEVF